MDDVEDVEEEYIVEDEEGLEFTEPVVVVAVVVVVVVVVIFDVVVVVTIGGPVAFVSK